MWNQWVLIFAIGFGVLGKWATGYEFDETEFHFNTTEVISLLEASSSFAAAADNPVLVGLTLIPGAAAKGAGTLSLSLSLSIYIYIYIYIYICIYTYRLYVYVCKTFSISGNFWVLFVWDLYMHLCGFSCL